MAVIDGLPYDPTTLVGQSRFHAADTDDLNYEFSDAEVNHTLDLASNNPRKAAAHLLMALAANRSRLAVSVRRGTVTEDLTKLAEELRKQAKELIAQAKDDANVPLDAVITPSYDDASYSRNLALERDSKVRASP